MKSDYEFCPDCGENIDYCVCQPLHECQEFDNDDNDWKFEYAFESVTESRSRFKKHMPIN